MTTPFPPTFSRRQAVRSLAGGSLLMPGILSHLLAEDARGSAGPAVGSKPAAAAANAPDPLAPRTSHFPARAKNVIFLFMTGGVSHVDSFDYKPKLFADAGKTVPGWAGGPP
ncbi:MAG: hypothetical protein JWO31_1414, partial [Phycisphaerales bacterium]|nr:hypothetical protein [Phycisphaerales bacterium]